MPGDDWMVGFKTRHNLTTRLSSNIKPNRAELSKDTINHYFDELSKVVGVDGKSIYNHDDMNVVDYPGVKKCIVRCGLHCVERKVAHSKSATSLMFCGNAEGKYSHEEIYRTPP